MRRWTDWLFESHPGVVPTTYDNTADIIGIAAVFLTGLVVAALLIAMLVRRHG